MHNVASEYWGSGKTGQGRNQYGRILERIRKTLGNNSKDEITHNLPDDQGDKYNEHLVMKKHATTILLCDSVMKHVEPRKFRGHRMVHKQKVADTRELVSVSKALDANNNITEVVIHIGINDITSNKSAGYICDNINTALVTIKEKLPRATVVLSEMVAAQHNNVELANSELEDLTKKLKCIYVKHNLKPHMFQDDVHITYQATAILVADISRSLHTKEERQNTQNSWNHVPNHMYNNRGSSVYNKRRDNYMYNSHRENNFYNNRRQNNSRRDYNNTYYNLRNNNMYNSHQENIDNYPQENNMYRNVRSNTYYNPWDNDSYNERRYSNNHY